jgi:hypothetical protein
MKLLQKLLVVAAGEDACRANWEKIVDMSSVPLGINEGTIDGPLRLITNLDIGYVSETVRTVVGVIVAPWSTTTSELG